MLFAVLALTFLAYVTTLQFKFVYDDGSQIVGNQLIEHWRYLPHYFNIQVWAHVNPHQAGNYYRPIFMVWMLLNEKLFGDQPFGWHLTTVLMHVLTTWLVFRLARRLSRRDDFAIIAALIFGLHPVHIEAVAWVSGVTESLLAALLIPAFLWYLDWREGKPNARAYSLVFFTLAMFSKETAVLMAPLVFAYEWLYPRRPEPSLLHRFWNSLKPSLPYGAVIVGYLGCRALALDGLMHTQRNIGLGDLLLTIPSVLWFYLRLLIAPIGLSAFYDTPYITSPSFLGFVLPLLGVLLVAAAILLWWWKSRDPLIAFSFVLLTLPLLPLMNFNVFFQGEIAHDRYLYLPSIGFAMLVATALSKLPSHEHPGSVRHPGLMVAMGISIAFLILTTTQSLYWADNFSLYYRGVRIAPNNNLALNNLANELLTRKMYPQSIALYEKVLSRNPNFYLANYNLGYALMQTGRFREAANMFRRAAVLDSTDAETFLHLASCDYQLNELNEAEAALHRAIATDPRLLRTRYMLGLVLKKQGRNQEALDYFRAELDKNPHDTQAQSEVNELTGK
jgi:protein O-mannosyl-transferase